MRSKLLSKQILARISATMVFSLLSLLSIADVVRAEKVAFVIGINRYDHLGTGQQLKRAVNDARSIAEVLRHLGFKVEVGEDLDRPTFNRAWQSFLDRVSPGDEAAFFFLATGLKLKATIFCYPETSQIFHLDDRSSCDVRV